MHSTWPHLAGSTLVRVQIRIDGDDVPSVEGNVGAPKQADHDFIHENPAVFCAVLQAHPKSSSEYFAACRYWQGD